MSRIFRIGKREIGLNHQPFIIAEAGINHNGDIETAYQMIDIAASSEVDAVKFQTFHAEDFISDRSVTYSYKSKGQDITESMFDMFKRVEFTKEEWRNIKQYCVKKNIEFLSTPVTPQDLDFLELLGVNAVKIGSDDFNNIPLIRDYAKRGLPVLISCGMSTEEEIVKSIKAAREYNESVCLLLCTSQYPTPPSDVNARKLITLHELFPDIVLGFSDHTVGSVAAVVALAYGARIFEKHFTLDHEMTGPDHWFSCDPDELLAWAQDIRYAYSALGSCSLVPTDKEKEMRLLARRSVVALKDIDIGEVLSEFNIGLRRPGTGIPSHEWDDVVGKRAVEQIPSGRQITWQDVK